MTVLGYCAWSLWDVHPIFSLHGLSHSAALSTHLDAAWNAVPAGWGEKWLPCRNTRKSSVFYWDEVVNSDLIQVVMLCLFACFTTGQMCHWTLILLMYNFPGTLLPSLNFSQQLSFFLLKVVRDKGQSGCRYLKPYWLISTRGLRSSWLHLHPLTRLCTWLQFTGQSPFQIQVSWYQAHLLTSPQSWFKK